MVLPMRRRARWLWLHLVIGSAILAGAPAGAQAPYIAPRGVPVIRSDTIYRLAVDSARYRDLASILLLDDVVITVEADGRNTRTYHHVIQVLRQPGVPALQEQSLEYDRDHEHATIRWIRVLKPDGTIISEKPSQMQESDVAASTIDPVYAHRRVIRLSLSGIAPGTLVDASWTVEDWKPYRPGDLYLRWRLATETSVRRARLVIDAPKNLSLRMIEHHLDFARRDTVIGLRRVYQWTKQQVLWQRQEPFAPPVDSTDAAVGIDVTAPGTWHDVGHWFAGLAAARLRPDARLRDTVQRVVAHATTLVDSVRALHRWVAQDIRYVQIALGLGGFQPRFPDTVLATGFGDCKDKATLLIDALGLIGVQAFPVLTNATNQPDSTLPTIQAFDHEIVAVKQPTGYQYVDPTSEYSRFGTLPFPDAGKFALIVHPGGDIEQVTTPPDPADSNRSVVTLTGELASDGTFSGRVEAIAGGALELWLRAVMSPTQDTAQRTAILQSLVSEMIHDVKIDSLVSFDGKDFAAKPVVSFVIRNAHPTQRSGDVDILPLVDRSAAFQQMAYGVAHRYYRGQAIDAERILPAATLVSETHITLPPGWHARLPPSVSATSVFGTFAATYQQEDRLLTITRRTVGGQGIYPKNRYPELVAWLLECAKDHTPVLVIEHGRTGS
jgi:transglutaminase-like putative cysteine protease